MTTAQHRAMYPRSIDSDGGDVRTGTTRAGSWTYVPAPADGDPDAGPVLRRGADEVALHYAAPALETLLATLRRVEVACMRRWQAMARPAVPATAPFDVSGLEYPGQSHRV
ncbi:MULTISPECIES: hypothetical protein [Streptomyces]|uniref:hypothetical protein n=1 Tax=Streptomyces TaxID=1883 RepID=UPI00167404AD|nr:MULTISPECIES: hypothetical protein [Streptomyces]MBD3576991.1 hypothetical protein [Streptomyces sp. KD18]GGT04669.1 hypothetical protein GCM10010286_32240 [Streptomyces toxytricini]